MTPQTIITVARDILNDTDADGYRNSNDELVRYVNDGLKAASVLRPDLFYTTGDMPCTDDKTEQAVSFADAQALVDIIRIVDGPVITPIDASALSLFRPGWGSDEAAPAQHWFRHPGDPLRFYLCPKAPADQSIEIKYVRIPATVTLTSEITDIPASFEPAMVDYVVSRAESKDDEHVNSGRATAHYAAFSAKLKPSA